MKTKKRSAGVFEAYLLIILNPHDARGRLDKNVLGLVL